jgi:hypothetical protein
MAQRDEMGGRGRGLAVVGTSMRVRNVSEGMDSANRLAYRVVTDRDPFVSSVLKSPYLNSPNGWDWKPSSY